MIGERLARAVLSWAALVAALAVPVMVAAMSPLLAWRDSVYIVAGFAGVLALGLLLVQPLLAGGYLPGVPARSGRLLHGWVGAVLVSMVVLHVGALWLTSPPDVIDALLFESPTPFSAWGVVAMWAVFAAALVAALRRRLRPVLWRRCHMTLAIVIVVGSVVHAMLIEGSMGLVSKTVLCVVVLGAAAKVMVDKARQLRTRRSRSHT